MDRIDTGLSRRAQEFWATALVICRNEGSGMEVWVLQRPGLPPLLLGESFADASEQLKDLVAEHVA